MKKKPQLTPENTVELQKWLDAKRKFDLEFGSLRDLAKRLEISYGTARTYSWANRHFQQRKE